MLFNTFISPQELNNHLKDKNLVIIDCRFDLTNKELGKQLYEQKHIPGANFADLETDLSGKVTEKTGRHPLPELKSFKQWLQKNGLGKQKLIIVYDNVAGAFAARLWWMIRTLGYQRVCVLEGGIDSWINLNYKYSSGTEHYEQLKENIDLPSSWDNGLYPLVTTDQMYTLIGSKEVIIIDSRDPQRYRGETIQFDPIAGHIPTAKNYWHKMNILEENNRLKPKEVLSEQLANIINPNDSNKAIFYCGSGVTSCFNVLICEYLGLKIPKVYIGSWSEWSRNYPNKIEIGNVKNT